MPRVDEGSDQWRVDGQEFPALGTQKTASTIIGSVDPGDTGRGRPRDGHPSPTPRVVGRPRKGHPSPTPRVVDRGMRPAKISRAVRKGNRDVRTRGVQGTLTAPLSPLAKSFTPRPTPDKSQNQRQYTDIDQHRSPATTGVGEMESSRNNIEDKNATMVLAKTIEIEQPVAMGDVAEPGGPAGNGAGGPVVTEIRTSSVFSQETTELRSVDRPRPGPVVRSKLRRDAVLRTGLPRSECGPELELVGRS